MKKCLECKNGGRSGRVCRVNCLIVSTAFGQVLSFIFINLSGIPRI